MAAAAAASSSSTTSAPRPRLRGVVFDMDSTLTVPVIDFQAMYRAVLGDDEYVAVKLKSPAEIDILRQIEIWSPEKQQKAYEIIADYEQQGMDRLRIMPVFDDSNTFAGRIHRMLKLGLSIEEEETGGDDELRRIYLGD